MSNWRTLLGDILDDLIERENGNVDLNETAYKAFELREKLNEKIAKMTEFGSGNAGPVNVKVKRLSPDATLPTYATDGSAAFDLYAAQDVVIEPGSTEKVPLGLSVEIPAGYVMFIVPRSGVSLRTNLRQPNSIGVIDSDFRGELAMLFDNTTEYTDTSDYTVDTLDEELIGYHEPTPEDSYIVRKGDRVCQAWVQPVPPVTFTEVDELDATERGAGGFGSSGVSG
ncbi:dUTP diphosphatase [Salibacterium lacus]|uniref:dUTP diphosphatase n=1 Tax=Salibacterium lacus TaxID=1898109 RepID=A0ABW5SZC9_9BACI